MRQLPYPAHHEPVLYRFGVRRPHGGRSVLPERRRHGDVPCRGQSALRRRHDDRRLPERLPRSVLRYLHNSHDYFLQYRLPDIRRKLSEAVACGRDGIAEAIIRFFDDYAAEVHKHMMYEEETVFPYVRQLLTGECPAGYDIETFHRQHDQIEAKLTELKNILIKYYPASESCGKEMNGVLFDIFLCESELASHNDLENRLFIPAVAEVERKIRDAR